MALQQLEQEMNTLSLRHYRELQVVLRRHRQVIDDRKATLCLFKYMSDFIGLGWQGLDKKLVIANFLDVQRDIEERERKNNG